MVDLATLAAVAEILGALSILAGVGYVAIELRRQRQQRRLATTSQVFEIFHSEGWARSIRVVTLLPDHAPPRAVHEDPAVEEAAVHVCNALNSLGYALHYGTVDRAMIEGWTQGVPQLCWRKLDAWVAAARALGESPELYRWFEWLVHASGPAGSDAAVDSKA